MPLVTLVNPVAVWRPLAVAGQSLESRQRLATSAPSEFELGRFMECERGPQPCGSKGSSRRRDCRSPLQRATLVIESAALCLAVCVRVSRERRYRSEERRVGKECRARGAE